MRGRGSSFVFLHLQDLAPALRFAAQTFGNRVSALGRRLRRWFRPEQVLDTAPGPAQAPLVDTACQAWPDFAGLRAEPAWSALTAQAGSLFETPAWFDNLASTCPLPDVQTLVLAVADAGAHTYLPLRRRRGGKLESLSNFYAPLFHPLCSAPAHAAAHAPSFAAWLAAHNVPTLQLHPLDAQATFWRALMPALKARGYWVDSYFSFGNWYHPCAGVRWAQYLATRPSRLRHTIERSRKRLAAQPGVAITLLDGASPAPLVQQAVRDFNTVYGRSWKKPEPFGGFIEALVRLAHGQGWLRMALCHLDGQPVAAQIWLVRDGVASIFKLAYDERHGKLGAGTVLSAALTERVLDADQVHEIDFLAGDDPYKAEWMSQRRERRGIVAFLPRRPAGLFAAALHFGARALRRPEARGRWEGRRGIKTTGRVGAGETQSPGQRQV
jgi:CelD/BcsL family acetyltransferase involved in cellulose biosynthesis